MTEQNIRKLYTLSNNQLNIDKMINDLSIYMDFEEEYHIKEIGGMRKLREILGDKHEFYKKYKKE